MNKCVECGREIIVSSASEDRFCDKFCEKEWCDKEEGSQVVAQVAPSVHTFKPYYNESHNVQVNTPAEHRAFVKRTGGLLGDYEGQRRRMAYTAKHREDIIHDRYAKLGVKYPKGKKVTFDEKNGRFIPRH